MKRDAENRLIEWKNSPRRKPLIVMGARQVGKTYLLQQFGRDYYDHIAYINCDNNPRVANLFAEGYDIERIILAIGAITEVPIIAGKTLIVLDEILLPCVLEQSYIYFHIPNSLRFLLLFLL